MRVRISRKRIGVPAVVTLLMTGIVVGAVAWSAESGDASGARQASHWAFQPVGSWVWTVDLGIGSKPTLITFHRDGTIAFADSFMFGNPLAPPAGQGEKLSPGHGVWQHTGGRTFGGTSLWFRFSPLTGFVTGYVRGRSALEMVDKDRFEGVIYADSLAGCNMTVAAPPAPPIGCPDPTDPDAVWTPNPIMQPGGFPVSATRIHRLPLPE